MAWRYWLPRKRSSASFSRCAACEAIWPYAASPAPMAATMIMAPMRVKPFCFLPAFIPLGPAVHVVHAALLHVGGRHGDPGRGGAGERIVGDGAKIALHHQLLERARILAGVGVVLVQRVAQRDEIFLEHGLLGAAHPAHVIGPSDGKKKREDGQHGPQPQSR